MMGKLRLVTSLALAAAFLAIAPAPASADHEYYNCKYVDATEDDEILLSQQGITVGTYRYADYRRDSTSSTPTCADGRDLFIECTNTFCTRSTPYGTLDLGHVNTKLFLLP